MTQRVRRALVTGASAGIGREFCRQLAQRHVELVVVARREDRLQALADELDVACEILPADLASPEDLRRVEERLASLEAPVDLLVNNAGFGAYGPFVDVPLERQLAMIDLNVTALVRCARAVLTQLTRRDTGGLINVGSTAGFQPDPHAAVYGASKAFVRSFSQAVHEELRGTGVRSMLLAPGLTDTEFQSVADLRLQGPLEAATMSAEQVVAAALRDFTRGRAVCIPGAVNKLTGHGSDVTPSAVSRRLSGVVHRRMAGS